jgi:hypothetical protein
MPRLEKDRPRHGETQILQAPWRYDVVFFNSGRQRNINAQVLQGPVMIVSFLLAVLL